MNKRVRSSLIEDLKLKRKEGKRRGQSIYEGERFWNRTMSRKVRNIIIFLLLNHNIIITQYKLFFKKSIQFKGEAKEYSKAILRSK
jgi:hypothetical protein